MGLKKPLLCFFIFMVFLSCLLPLGTHAAGNRVVRKAKVSNREMTVEEKELLDVRMDIEINDYPGSGANNRHDPRGPGKD